MKEGRVRRRSAQERMVEIDVVNFVSEDGACERRA